MCLWESCPADFFVLTDAIVLDRQKERMYSMKKLSKNFRVKMETVESMEEACSSLCSCWYVCGCDTSIAINNYIHDLDRAPDSTNYSYAYKP